MHIMIDLETMGTRPNAPIIAIGAVVFNGAGIGGDFYMNVDLKSDVDSGAVIDPSTVLWWMQQSDEARASLLQGGVPIEHALVEFSAFLPETISGVWGNGATFDNVLIREAYGRANMRAPWPFWLDKCYRTVKGAFPSVELKRSGTHHNALDDARSQAEHLIAINKTAGGVFL